MKNCVVTGTSRGIGLELSALLLQAGNNVVALARNPEKSKALIELKEKFPEKLQILTADVTSDADISAAIKDIKVKQVDLLINNAGIYGEDVNFEKLKFSEVEKTISTNSVTPMRVTRALLPLLKNASNPKVVHITSLMGSLEDNTSGGSYGYRMSKAALNMFHKSFTADYPKITSLVIHPGWVKTDMGGSAAPTLPKTSASGILAVVEKASLKDSGKFLDFEGDKLPW